MKTVLQKIQSDIKKRRDKTMCITKKELETKVEELRSLGQWRKRLITNWRQSNTPLSAIWQKTGWIWRLQIRQKSPTGLRTGRHWTGKTVQKTGNLMFSYQSSTKQHPEGLWIWCRGNKHHIKELIIYDAVISFFLYPVAKRKQVKFFDFPIVGIMKRYCRIYGLQMESEKRICIEFCTGEKFSGYFVSVVSV